MTDKSRYYGHLFLLATIVLSLFIYQTNRGNLKQDIKSKAAYDPQYCQENCGGDKDPCTGTKIKDIYDADCCARIKSTGDPMECSWPARGWCFPEDCSTIPEDVNRQRCAAPRSVYCQMCRDNGCYTPTSPPTRPPPTAVPASPPVVPTETVPTFTPPTEVPPTIIEPTNYERPTIPVLPTQIIQIPRPTYPPILTPTNVPFRISPPNILPPREKVVSFITAVKTNLLDFFSKILP